MGKLNRVAVLLVALGGCSSPSPPETPAETPALSLPTVPPPLVRETDQTKTAIDTPPPPPEPSAFRFPADRAGEALAKVSRPELPVTFPVERWAESPLPRAIPTALAEPQPVSRLKLALPAIDTPPRAVHPSWPVPPERLPIVVGLDEVPTKPVLPVSQMKPARAADPNVPPPLPTLARKVTDRVPVTDPTHEATNAAISSRPVQVTWTPSPFFKATIPDPFDYADHVKHEVPREAQPAVTPVIVPPQRP
ncbi:MAG: hypothetical protein RMJ56_08430 [Gemmataceae bacterium]|nr:hypothetical protein [Gemmata sp.]MDW8197611.1 hypothetical protein [Gemmataceae bacterium]